MSPRRLAILHRTGLSLFCYITEHRVFGRDGRAGGKPARTGEHAAAGTNPTQLRRTRGFGLLQDVFDYHKKQIINEMLKANLTEPNRTWELLVSVDKCVKYARSGDARIKSN